MKDKDIRKILISYLQAQGKEMRIYQEKSIGTSICDVMAVTDKLSGYEIKSDGDDLRRLDDQVRAYTAFFDENWLVVSKKHEGSASDHVPAEWGIICIDAGSVQVTRPAKTNRFVNRRRQLSILWKLELKNILTKNEMPLYAQREKGFIADRIAETVEDGILQKQIAMELLHRDYSVYDAKDYSLYSEGLQHELPAAELVDMLSEKDLRQYTLDQWINLYKQAMEVQEQKESLYVEEKTQRTPHEIPYTDIEVSLGAPWIGKQIVNDFIRHIVGYDDGRYKYEIDFCEYEPVTGNWFVRNKRSWGWNTNVAVRYGLERYNALFIIEATLNLRQIRLFDKNNRYSEADTVAALEKQKKIEQEFKDWIWLDEDRRWLVEDAYNRIFAGKPAAPDGSSLSFPDMSEDYRLYPYQRDAVQKILESNNTLLAFDVGAGKTYIMIAAAMKLRQSGLSRKNMFVVPNHIVGQWEKMFTDLYPRAKVLAIEPKSFKPEMRQKVLRQIQEGDYDGVVIAYSCFEMIPLSTQTVLKNMDADVSRIEQAINDLRTSRSYNLWNKNELEKEKARIVKLTHEFLDSINVAPADGVSFESLEINTLFLDEAHNYKNLPIKTRMKDLNGINTKGSAKCLDLLHKIRCVQNANGGRGAVFATGTPLCNSISDAYAMQMYLQYEDLREAHLDVFDNWVKTFAKPEQLIEIDVDTSKYRMVRKFVQFHNLPDLSRMFSRVAVFYAVNNAKELPELNGYTDEVIPKYPALCGYMKKLCERTEDIRSGKIDRKFDNMLKVSTDGRKAALDLTLVGAEQPYDRHSKIVRCVENAVKIYTEYEGATQLIFCDYATPKRDEFNVYDACKRRLVAAGIPEKEIAFIHSYHTESRKVELFRKFNAGEIRFLLGSTFKLGIGANVQTKLKAIHHLDVPWRPADMVQREGRILRRGNENRDVLIFRYIAQGSFDSYSWQILETKQRFISQFLSGSTYQRSVSDLEDNVLTYAEVKALALSEPLMKQLAEKENEVKALGIVVAKEREAKERMIRELEDAKKTQNRLFDRWINAASTLDTLRRITKEEKIKIHQSLSEALTPSYISGQTGSGNELRAFCFGISIPQPQDPKKPFLILKHRGEEYMLEVGNSPKGNAQRVLNYITGFQKVYDATIKERDANEARIRSLTKALQHPDTASEKRYIESIAELEKLKTIIKMRIEPQEDG